MPYRPTPERLKELNAPFTVKLVISQRRKTGWTFELRWWDGKTQRRQTLQTQNFQAALKARETWEQEITSARKSEVSPRTSPTVTEFLERYLEESNRRKHSSKYKQTIKWTFSNFRSFMRDKPIDLIQRDHVKNYLIHELDRGRKPTGVADDLRVLRAGFNWALENKWIKTNPVVGIKPPRSPRQLPRRFSIIEFRHLISVIDRDDDRSLALTLILTGMRISELLSLTWSNVHLDTGYIFIEGKGGHQREIPIGSFLKDVFESLPRHEESDLIFPGSFSLNKDRKPRGKISYSRLIKRFAQYLTKAGIEGEGVFHRFRHSFASILADSGHTSLELKQLLGHASTETTERYTWLGGTRLKETVEALNEGVRSLLNTRVKILRGCIDYRCIRLYLDCIIYNF